MNARQLLVWVIEDNDNFREPLCEILQKQDGIEQVQGFESCESSLKLMDSNAEARPNVILLDLGLPGMNGLEGIGEFLKRSDPPEIVVLTVFDDKPKVLDAILAGASGYLLKSSTPKQIGMAIHEVMAGGSPLTPQIARYVVDLVNRQKESSSEFSLSEREREVLDCLANGLIKKEIAQQLDISYHTVDKYVRRIYNKLQVNTLSGAVAKAIRQKII